MGAQLRAAAVTAGIGLAGGQVLVNPVGALLGLGGGGRQRADEHQHRHDYAEHLVFHPFQPPSAVRPVSR